MRRRSRGDWRRRCGRAGPASAPRAPARFPGRNRRRRRNPRSLDERRAAPGWLPARDPAAHRLPGDIDRGPRLALGVGRGVPGCDVEARAEKTRRPAGADHAGANDRDLFDRGSHDLPCLAQSVAPGADAGLSRPASGAAAPAVAIKINAPRMRCGASRRNIPVKLHERPAAWTYSAPARNGRSQGSWPARSSWRVFQGRRTGAILIFACANGVLRAPRPASPPTPPCVR